MTNSDLILEIYEEPRGQLPAQRRLERVKPGDGYQPYEVRLRYALDGQLIQVFGAETDSVSRTIFNREVEVLKIDALETQLAESRPVSTRQCSRCMYFKRTAGKTGECRERSPKVFNLTKPGDAVETWTSKFPEVDADWWCGKWEKEQH